MDCGTEDGQGSARKLAVPHACGREGVGGLKKVNLEVKEIKYHVISVSKDLR